MVARIPVPSDRSRGGRGASGQKREVGAAGGRRRGRLSRRGYWRQEPRSGLCGKEAKDGQRLTRSRRRRGPDWERSPRGGLRGNGGSAKKRPWARRGRGGRLLAASSLRLPPRLPPPPAPGHAPTFPSHRRRLGSAAARGLESPERPKPRAPLPSRSSPRAGRQRAPGRRAGPEPTGSAEGPGRGAAPSGPRGRAPRRLPCERSARESGAQGDPERQRRRRRLLARARAACQGRRVPAEPASPLLKRPPARPPPAPHPPAAGAHPTPPPGNAGLAPRPPLARSSAPLRPPGPPPSPAT